MEVIYEGKSKRYKNIKLENQEIITVQYLHDWDKEFNKNVELINDKDGCFLKLYEDAEIDLDHLYRWLDYSFGHKEIKILMRKQKLDKLINKEGS